MNGTPRAAATRLAMSPVTLLEAVEEGIDVGVVGRGVGGVDLGQGAGDRARHGPAVDGVEPDVHVVGHVPVVVAIGVPVAMVVIVVVSVPVIVVAVHRFVFVIVVTVVVVVVHPRVAVAVVIVVLEGAAVAQRPAHQPRRVGEPDHTGVPGQRIHRVRRARSPSCRRS